MIDSAGTFQTDLIPEIKRILRNLTFLPVDSDFSIYLQTTLGYLNNDPEFKNILESIKLTQDMSSSAAQIVRRMVNLDDGVPLTNRHARTAALSALLSRCRQGRPDRESYLCFASSIAIITQSDSNSLKMALQDYWKMLKDNKLVKFLDHSHSKKCIISIRTLPVGIKEPIIFENLLLKAREVILATISSYSNKGIIELNNALFSTKGFYSDAIQKYETEEIAINAPIACNEILNELKTAFHTLVKPVVENEKRSRLNGKFGYFHLERTDDQLPINNFSDYRRLQHDVIDSTKGKLTATQPSHRVYYENLFHSLHQAMMIGNSSP